MAVPGAIPPVGGVHSLLVLPASAKIGAGILMLALGIGGIAMGVGLYSLVLLGLGAGMGGPLLWSGLAVRKAQRLDDAERRRAEAALPALREVIAAAVAQKQNAGRVLRERGYERPRVRRWIALECGVVLRGGAAERPW